MDSTRPSRSSWLNTPSTSWGGCVRESAIRWTHAATVRPSMPTWSSTKPSGDLALTCHGRSSAAGKCFGFLVTIPAPGFDRSGQHVPVVWTGKFQPVDQRLVDLDEAIPDRRVHQVAEPAELVLLDIRPGPVERAEHLIEDLVRPLGLY